uniref:Uncharacterized protein n=1 Tax=Rousettus aegyptiacus TaxID=9407 RepID=A0A7J8IKR9_ROUAE|nr:hypothetical protein HJG63_010491 [Rousettus aegyptiacus]
MQGPQTRIPGSEEGQLPGTWTWVGPGQARFRGRGRWGSRPAHPAAFEGACSTECRLCLRSVAHSSPVAREAGRGLGSVAQPGVVSKDGLAARPLPAAAVHPVSAAADPLVQEVTDVGLCPIGGLGLGHPATSLRFGALGGDSGWWRHLPLGGPSED